MQGSSDFCRGTGGHPLAMIGPAVIVFPLWRDWTGFHGVRDSARLSIDLQFQLESIDLKWLILIVIKMMLIVLMISLMLLWTGWDRIASGKSELIGAEQWWSTAKDGRVRWRCCTRTPTTIGRIACPWRRANGSSSCRRAMSIGGRYPIASQLIYFQSSTFVYICERFHSTSSTLTLNDWIQIIRKYRIRFS